MSNKKVNDFVAEFLYDNQGLTRLIRRNIKTTVKDEMKTLLDLYKESDNELSREEQFEAFQTILNTVSTELKAQLDEW